MNLAEMLEYTAGEYLDDRTELVDGDPDSLWSDSFLVKQFNQAQRILCRRAWCIIESTGAGPAGYIILQTGKVLYPVHKSILRVFDVTPSTQDAPLGRTEDINLRDPSPAGADAFDKGEAAALAGHSTLNTSTLAVASDAGTRTVRVFPAPTADQNGVRCTLKIARLPITWLTLDDMDAEPEVPEDWHMDICEYAAGKALTLPNVDSEQKPEGRRLLDAFDATVREARRDRQRFEMDSARWGFSSATAVLR